MKGRKNFPSPDLSGTDQVIWMHCASLGEFEQGRPVLEQVRLLYPGCKTVVTFFSPSGYEIRKNYNGTDYTYYLPTDSRAHARRFISAINPKLVLWIKYEYWFYYLDELKKRNIPTLLISGVYRENMQFFKWYGGIWRKMLESFSHFFVQNEQSQTVLEKLVSPDRVTNSGDTRFDRVIATAEKFEEVAGIKEFCGTNKVIVAGSTWEDDEAELTHYVKVHPEIKFIIAPHEIDKENLKDVKKEFPNSVFYSDLIDPSRSMANNAQPAKSQTPSPGPRGANPTPPTPNCLIIDNIGTLSRLYKYADITYVGGGFGYNGLHNILEAAVYAKPVIFGPEYEKNFEAVELIDNDGAISIDHALELEEILNDLFNDDSELRRRSEVAGNYVRSKAGATAKIIEYIQRNRLLIN